MEPIESSPNGITADSGAAHYSGVVVVVPPARIENCARELDALEGVEVHYRQAESGRIVAVLEGGTAAWHEEILQRIQAVPGVLVVAPVYHYVDTNSELAGDEPGSCAGRREQ